MRTLWVLAVLVGCKVHCWPSIHAPRIVHQGASIAIDYELDDGHSAPMSPASMYPYTSTEDQGIEGERRTLAPDWIGIFPVGECDGEEMNVHLRHKCFIDAQQVPVANSEFHSSGTMYFDVGSSTGKFEARYFYGDDATEPGAYAWAGQGLVCSTYLNVVDLPGAANPPTPPRTQRTNGQDPRSIYEGWEGKSGNGRIKDMSVSDCQCDEDTVVSEIRVLAAHFGLNCPRSERSNCPRIEYHRGGGVAPHAADIPPNTDGINCDEVPFENQTGNVADACDGVASCNFVIDTATIGNPRQPLNSQARINLGVAKAQYFCEPEFWVEYTCGNYSRCPPSSVADGHSCFEHIAAPADMKTISLNCPQEAARDECRSKRHACSNCFLDPVAITEEIEIVGGSDPSVQHAAMAHSRLPGFEHYEVNNQGYL